jgi:hypothetical protein
MARQCRVVFLVFFLKVDMPCIFETPPRWRIIGCVKLWKVVWLCMLYLWNDSHHPALPFSRVPRQTFRRQGPFHPANRRVLQTSGNGQTCKAAEVRGQAPWRTWLSGDIFHPDHFQRVWVYLLNELDTCKHEKHLYRQASKQQINFLL